MILHELLSYDVLRVIWWLLLGVLLVAFAVTDGFDLGVGMLNPFVARTDVERCVGINTVGPIWEGNQVWLILGGGPFLPPGRSCMRCPSRAFTSPCLPS